MRAKSEIISLTLTLYFDASEISETNWIGMLFPQSLPQRIFRELLL